MSVVAALGPGTGACAGSHEAGLEGGEPTYPQCCEPAIPRDGCDPSFGYWDDFSKCCVTCLEGPMMPPGAPV